MPLLRRRRRVSTSVPGHPPPRTRLAAPRQTGVRSGSSTRAAPPRPVVCGLTCRDAAHPVMGTVHPPLRWLTYIAAGAAASPAAASPVWRCPAACASPASGPSILLLPLHCGSFAAVAAHLVFQNRNSNSNTDNSNIKMLVSTGRCFPQPYSPSCHRSSWSPPPCRALLRELPMCSESGRRSEQDLCWEANTYLSL